MNKAILATIAIIVIVAGVLAVFGTSWGILPFMIKDCSENNGCWIEAEQNCAPAKYVYKPAVEASSEQYFESRGKDPFTNECIVYTKIIQVNIPESALDDIGPELAGLANDLEGKDMLCRFPNGIPEPVGFFRERNYCKGEQKEALDAYVSKYIEIKGQEP